MNDSTSMTSKADFTSATGTLAYNLTNDFLFKALLQKNEHVLKALICSLLHLEMEEIHSIMITNPIEFGNSIHGKTFFLDVKLILNDETIINLEMQVINEENWPERSLSYLSRSFDNLNKGTDYTVVKPAIHIGFLNFSPKHVPREFYSTYKLLNVKNYSVYSDKFVLSVVDLTQVELATEEDKKYQIDHWARLFRATTWEEVKMIAEKNQYLYEASSTLYQLTAEDIIREQCEERERFYNHQKGIQRLMESRIDTILKQEEELQRQEKELKRQEEEMRRQEEEMRKQEEELQKRGEMIEALNDEKQLLSDQIMKMKELLKKSGLSPE